MLKKEKRFSYGSRIFIGGKYMKKYSWIVALLLALSFTALFISCGEAFDATRLEPKPWVIDAKDIKLEKIGSNEGASAEGNTFTNQAKGGASSTGFAWKVPTEKNADGFEWSNFEKVRVTIKIVDLKQPAAGVSYNAKTDRAMGTDVNRFGETKQYANATIVTGGPGDEAYADYPTAKFKDSGEIAFQYNCWEGNSDIVAGGGRTEPNHKIEVGFTFFTKMEGEKDFVPVTNIELVVTKGFTYTDFKLEAKITPADATNQEIIWAIFPKAATEGSGTSMITSKTTIDDVEFQRIPAANVTEVTDDSTWPWSTSTSDASINQGRNGKYPNIIIATEDGKVNIVALIKDGKGPGEDYIQRDLVIDIDLLVFPKFSNAKSLGLPTATYQWTFGTGIDKHGTSADLFGATYFVIAATMTPNPAGIGGIQLTVQGDPSWAGAAAAKTTGDWTGCAHEERDFIYLVIDLSEYSTDIDALETANSNNMQFYAQYGGSELGLCSGYVTTADLSTKPAGASTFSDTGTMTKIGGNSYVTKTPPAGLILIP
jgi:hypothetical protein